MNLEKIFNSDNKVIKEELSIINNDLLKQYFDEMKDFKTDLIYDSKIHGIKHNVRVSICVLILANDYSLKREDFNIVLDAAKYHDIGRINDLDDLKHGKRSSEMINFLSKKYSDIDLSYLKLIMEAHSIPDSKRDNLFKKYKLDDINRYHRLYDILKDSDALDRVRTGDLDMSYIRTNKGKKLEKFSHELYKIYN